MSLYHLIYIALWVKCDLLCIFKMLCKCCFVLFCFVWEPVLLFFHIGPRGCTQIIGFDGKCLDLLSTSLAPFSVLNENCIVLVKDHGLWGWAEYRFSPQNKGLGQWCLLCKSDLSSFPWVPHDGREPTLKSQLLIFTHHPDPWVHAHRHLTLLWVETSIFFFF